MIVCVNYENLYKHGKAFHSQFRLRHECFIERQNYNVSNYRGMEYDQYDTPAATYLVYLSPAGTAWGCSRLTPTERGSMLKDLWPELISEPEKVFGPNVWEGTRFCIEKNLPAGMRLRICRELVIGYFETGLDMGMKKIIGVMPPFILRKVFGSSGCRYEALGKHMKISSGDVIAAASMDITWEALINVRRTTGIFERVTGDTNVRPFDDRKVA